MDIFYVDQCTKKENPVALTNTPHKVKAGFSNEYWTRNDDQVGKT